MFIHLGRDKVVDLKNVIGIFDLESTTVYKPTRDFLDKAQKEGRVVDVCHDLPKTFVVVRENGEDKVYISGFNTQLLQKKAAEFLKEDNALFK